MTLNNTTKVKLVLHGDSEEIKKYEGIGIKSPSGYIEARKRIRNVSSSEKKSKVEIHVGDKRYWRWLRDLREIGSPEITIDHDDARRQLEKRWNSTIPANLSSKEIQTLGLLELSAPSAGQDSSDYILQNVLDPVWLQESCPAHVIELTLHITSSEPSQDDSEEEPYAQVEWVRRKQREKAKKWFDASDERLRPFYGLFIDYPVDASKLVCISLFALSSNRTQSHDKKHGNNVWREYASSLESGHHVLDDWLEMAQLLLSEEVEPCRQLEGIGRELLGQQLLAYWNTILSDQDPEEVSLKDLLELLPGSSLAELEALRRYIDGLDQVYAAHGDERQEIKEKYGAFEGGFKKVDSFLKEHTIPELPPKPKTDWKNKLTLKAWKKWLKEEYIPFKKSIDNLKGRIRKDKINKLEERAKEFSDWYTKKYKEITYRGDETIADVLKNVTELADQGRTVVWVIWDNLPATHSGEVLQSARKNGLHLSQSREWRLSALPSVTEVCMPVLLSGSPSLGQDKLSMTRAELVNEFTSQNIKVSYSKSLKELEDESEDKKDIYIVHYRDYDKKLHKKEYDLEERRSVELRRSRERIFEHLGGLIDNLSSDSDVSVVISSDHGSSLLPDHSVQVQLPDGLDSRSLSSRASVLPEANSDLESLFDREITTVLDADNCMLSEYCAIARGFRSFVSLRSDDGYVHGGALPEEVLTPLMILEPERPEYKPLNVSVIESELRRGEIQPLRIKLTNYNDERVGPVHLRLVKSGNEYSKKVIENIDKRTYKKVEEKTKLRKQDSISGGHIQIEVRLSIQYLGRTEYQTESISVPASERAVDSQTGEGLDSFFD